MIAANSNPVSKRRQGAILIIVMWISLGLISLALYFGHSMIYQARMADNRVAGVEAEQAIEGAVRYVSFIISNNPGLMPDLRDYQYEEVPIGDATFWIIGRGDSTSASTATVPEFGLTDETGKLNINTCVRSNLMFLPRTTDDIVDSILNWRSAAAATNGTTTTGATDQTYSSLNPGYSLKGSNFESVAELRMVYGVDINLLYGRDLNLNGIVDYNEKTLDVPIGLDANGGTVDSGLLEFLTVYSMDPNLQTNFTSARANVTNGTDLANVLNEYLPSDTKLAATLTNQVVLQQAAPHSLLEYYVRNISSGISRYEFEEIYDYITVSNGIQRGMINVNTASRTVLNALDGMTPDMVEILINYRDTNPDNLRSIAWVAEALNITAVADLPKCHPLLTTHTYQITADIVALGRHNRGYRRVRVTFDTSTGVPQIIYRQDLTHLGWALGKDIRDSILNSKEIR